MGPEGVTPDPETIDARLLCREVKEIRNVVKSLASNVNAALLKFKDVDTRIEDLHTAQTRIVSKLEVLDKFIPHFEKPRKDKSVPKNGGGSKGNVDGVSQAKKPGRKGKGKTCFIAKDIMNIEFDVNVDNDPVEKKGADPAKGTQSSAKQSLHSPEAVTPIVKTSQARNTLKATMNPRFSKSLRSVTPAKVLQKRLSV